MSLEDGVKICAKLSAKIYVWDERDSKGGFPILCYNDVGDCSNMLIEESL